MFVCSGIPKCWCYPDFIAFFFLSLCRLNSSVNAKQIDNKESRFLNFSGTKCFFVIFHSLGATHTKTCTHTRANERGSCSQFCVCQRFHFRWSDGGVVEFSGGCSATRFWHLFNSHIFAWWIYRTVLSPIHGICVVRHAVHNLIHFQNPTRRMAWTRIVSSSRCHFFMMLLHSRSALSLYLLPLVAQQRFFSGSQLVATI